VVSFINDANCRTRANSEFDIANAMIVVYQEMIFH